MEMFYNFMEICVKYVFYNFMEICVQSYGKHEKEINLL